MFFNNTFYITVAESINQLHLCNIFSVPFSQTSLFISLIYLFWPLKFQSSSRDKFILGFRLCFVRFWMLWMLVPGKKKGVFFKKNYCIQLNKSNVGNILPGWKMMKASSKHFFQSVQEQQHKGKKKERKKNNNCKAF